MVEAGNNLKASYAYVVVFVVATVLYIATCAPGALWQDSGMYQYRIQHNDIEGKLGLALSHPLYHIIGIGVKHIRLGEFAYRINLISAVAAAFTVANLFLLLRLWLKRILPAVTAAATLAFSHTFWQHAVIAETYTLYTALLLSELLMLLQYVKTKRMIFLYLLGLFNGLAAANHNFAVIALVCYLVFLIVLLARRQIKVRHFGIVVLLWIIGAAPYECLILKNIIRTGDFTATLASAFFGKRWQGNVLNINLSARLIKENLLFLAYNFPTPNAIFFFVGLGGLKKMSPTRSFAHIFLALLILFFVFAFRYTVPDRYAFFIPFYCLASVIIGVGVNFFVARYNYKILCLVILILSLLPIPTYMIAPGVAQRQKFNLYTRADVPYRNDYLWFLCPWKRGYRGAEKFAEEVFDKLGQDAVVYADNTMVYPLLYMQQVKGKRADIKIISTYAGSGGLLLLSEKSIEQWLLEGDVYAVSPIGGRRSNGIVWKIVD